MAASLAYDGVVHRARLRQYGIDRAQVRECRAGRWVTAGRHTIVVVGSRPAGEGLLWHAVWEGGSGAVLDGMAALVAQGLQRFTLRTIDLTVPGNHRPRPLPGVRTHLRRHVGPVMPYGIPRVRPEVAAIRAAQWAPSDRAAALAICMPVQQRLFAAARLAPAWAAIQRSPRRRLLDQVIADVVDGAHSLGELDFAGHCRNRGLPPPTRQAVRVLPGGKAYLDAAWDEIGLAVEIDGSQHYVDANPVDDALRQNEVTIGNEKMLRIPLLGFRLAPEKFLDQVVRAHRLLALGHG